MPRNSDGTVKRFKLTMVSTLIKGKLCTKFFHLPVDETGAVKVPQDFFERNFQRKVGD